MNNAQHQISLPSPRFFRDAMREIAWYVLTTQRPRGIICEPGTVEFDWDQGGASKAKHIYLSTKQVL
jgi:hypothetical protein